MTRLITYALIIAGLAVVGWLVGSASFDCDSTSGDCGIGAAWAINGAYVGAAVGIAACLAYEVVRLVSRRRDRRVSTTASGLR